MRGRKTHLKSRYLAPLKRKRGAMFKFVIYLHLFFRLALPLGTGPAAKPFFLVPAAPAADAAANNQHGGPSRGGDEVFQGVGGRCTHERSPPPQPADTQTTHHTCSDRMGQPAASLRWARKPGHGGMDGKRAGIRVGVRVHVCVQCRPVDAHTHTHTHTYTHIDTHIDTYS